MQRDISIAALCLLMGLLIALPANAQCVNPALPIQQLNNTAWAFVTSDGFNGDATIGFFTAQVVPDPRAPSLLMGQLSITESYNNAGAILQRTAVGGQYTIDPDCSGGLLYINGSANAYQYRFVFAAGGTKMFLVTSNDSVNNNNGIGQLVGNRGKAVLLPAAPSCTGVGNPLSLFAGTWSFLAEDYFSADIGIINATTTQGRAGAGWGSLAVIETGSDVPPQVLASVPGSYQLSPDCSGGILAFATTGATAYAFVFANPNEIYMVSIAGTGATPGIFHGNFGTAVRQ